MEKIDADTALALLKVGNYRFVRNKLVRKSSYEKDREKLAKGQNPFAVVLCCADSRVSPEIFFNLQLGDIFVIRNAGNVVDEATLGSIEYGVEHLGAPVVVVIGHASCGAVTAVCKKEKVSGHINFIADMIKPVAKSGESIDDTAKLHAKNMAKKIAECETIAECGAQVVPAFYDIASGAVSWL